MIRDHRPYWAKRLYLDFQKFYVRRFLLPQFSSLGVNHTFMKPWHVEIFGSPVDVGCCANIIASGDRKVRLSVWAPEKNRGRISIGDWCLICPGVRIGSAHEIKIGDNCMIASDSYITDSDWHDVYNRIATGKTAPVTIEENVWIGDRAIVCKGVTIGENSIIGTGAVVVHSIPPNTVAAGNPARPVKELEENGKMIKRNQWFSDPAQLEREIDRLDRDMLKGNTVTGWMKHLLSPKRGE